MANESDIFVRFGADIDPLKKGVDKATGTLSQFGTSARKTTNQLGKLGVAATAAGAAIGIKFVNDSLDAIDSQAKLAKQLNTTSVSIATLERATDRSGISMANVETAAKNLDIALGEAQQGTGVAVETLERLNLTAKDLEGMTLDKKILTINEAIKQNIPVVERGAAAADLFGKKAGFAVTQLDAETIQAAKEEVIGFGVAVSDVDAAKIENANDAMGNISLAVKGVSNQLTVTLAPILELIANDFKKAAIQTGGFKEEGVAAVQGVASAVGFLGNAFRGVEIALAGLDVGFQTLKTGALGIGAIFSDEMAAAADQAAGDMAVSIDELNAKLMEPLPSEVIDGYIAKLTDERILDAKKTQLETMNELDAQAGATRVQKEEEIQSAMARIRQSWGKKQTSAVSTMFSDLSTLQQSGNKKMFEVGKAAARAQTVMSTYEGAQKAYTSLAGIPIIGPALGVAAAGAAIAAGGIRLQAINSTSFGGGGSVSAGAASAAPAAASAPAAAAPQPQAQQVEISGINAGDMFSGEQLFGLIDKLNEAGEDGKTLNVSVA
jgi:hypothetical protein